MSLLVDTDDGRIETQHRLERLLKHGQEAEALAFANPAVVLPPPVILPDETAMLV